MPWLAVTLTVPADHVETLSDALLEVGALAADVADARAGTPQEQALFDEPGADPDDRWELTKVSALFEERADVSALVPEALSAAGLNANTAFQVDHVEDRDWVRATQSEFAPVPVSGRLWVVPTWHAPPDPAAINLVIDPGLAFGTGTHPTTRLCLAWLDEQIRGGETVLDYGCGSGILAIAALKLGARAAWGVDIDEQALLAARRNAMQNHVPAQFFAPEDAPDEPADIVVANILTNPLRVLAPLLANATQPGGAIALSGILDHQADELLAVYHEWFDMDAALHEEGWVLLSGIRR